MCVIKKYPFKNIYMGNENKQYTPTINNRSYLPNDCFISNKSKVCISTYTKS